MRPESPDRHTPSRAAPFRFEVKGRPKRALQTTGIKVEWALTSLNRRSRNRGERCFIAPGRAGQGAFERPVWCDHLKMPDFFLLNRQHEQLALRVVVRAHVRQPHDALEAPESSEISPHVLPRPGPLRNGREDDLRGVIAQGREDVRRFPKDVFEFPRETRHLGLRRT